MSDESELGGLTVWLPAELVEQLEAAAARSGRSVHDEIIHHLEAQYARPGEEGAESSS